MEMGDNIMLSINEDEEDLAALRLAALQSIKKKSNDYHQQYQFKNHFNGSPKGKFKRGGSFFKPNQNRPPRNGQSTNWMRNSNLISVPMVSTEGDKADEVVEVPKLIRPQDRYCKKLQDEEEESTSSPVSKFDRYNDSDESEDDDSDEDGDKSPIKRSASLEALMAELESEIAGESLPKPKETKVTVTKSVKKRPKVDIDTSSDKEVMEEVSKPPPPQIAPVKENVKLKPAENLEIHKPQPHEYHNRRKWLAPGKPRRNFQPPPPLHHHHHHHHPQDFMQPPPVVPQFAPPITMPPPSLAPYPYVQQFRPPPPMLYEPPPHFSEPPPLQILPPLATRPLSPLIVNTDAFGAPSTLAPLSPRSAAFVRQNRAIIEKRKRRSYSRSPSPRFSRRSKSMTPPPLKRRSLSPIRKVLPLVKHSPPKKPIHDRLGTKSVQKSPENKGEDPVLEARRKKFESNEVKIKGGVIRLKTNSDEGVAKLEEDEEVEDDESLLEIDDTIELDLKSDVMFSDEESNSDNEGRFKTKQESTNNKVPILPFAKLVNGGKSEIRPLVERRRERGRDGSRNGSERDRRRRSRSPVKRTVLKSTKKIDNNITTTTASKTSKQPIGFLVDKKIEIKIRNPTKYDGTEDDKPPLITGRKVELASKKIDVLIDDSDVVVEDTTDGSTGDLRAQLSRKRAERQKHPPSEAPPARILQSALQSVGFKKNRSKAPKSDDDGRLPIHLRLGTATDVGGSTCATSSCASPGKTKKKKRGSNQEQV